MPRFTLLPLFCLLFSIALPAQSAPAIEGELTASGVLEYGGRINGHFRLTDNTQDELQFAYTITLLGTDLQPLGKKVYESKVNLSFEAVVYNGKHLGVLIKEGNSANKRYLDVLDGAGDLVRRVDLETGFGTMGLFVHPIDGAFVTGVARAENFNGIQPRIRLLLNKVTSNDDGTDWSREFSGEKKRQSVIPRFLDGNEERLVFTINRFLTVNDTYKYEDLYCLDPRTGNTVYRFLQEEKDKSGDPAVILQGELVKNELILVRHKPERLQPQGVGVSLDRYDAAGNSILNRNIATKRMLREVISGTTAHELGDHLTLVPSLLQAGPSGEITIGFESYADLTDRSERHFGSAFVMGLGTDFQPVAVVEVPKTQFRVSNRHLKSLNAFSAMSINRKLQKGQVEKLNAKQLIALHGGPYSYTLTYAGQDYISGYFLDRTFATSGVTYHAIHAVTFLDGEFIHERIPLEHEPDYITLGPAKEGYLQVTEYKLGKGITDIRLERLSY